MSDKDVDIPDAAQPEMMHRPSRYSAKVTFSYAAQTPMVVEVSGTVNYVANIISCAADYFRDEPPL